MLRPAALTVLGALCAFATSATASAQERSLSIGVGAHLVTSLDDVCDRDGDVVGCSVTHPFAGADVSAHLWLVELLAVGVRVAGSKDLDGSESESSTGERSDRDQWLWRLSAEARLDPPLLPRGLWVAGEVGIAFVVDSLEHFDADGDRLRGASTTQDGWLLGAALGWDFALGESLLLGFELRAQLIGLPGDPPSLQGDAEALEFGTAPWLGLGLRFTYQR